MSDTTPRNQSTHEVELIKRFSEQMARLCMSDDYSDVAFMVEGQRLPAHRAILAARSTYFSNILSGGLSEDIDKEIDLKSPLEAFKAVLKYIYSGHMPLSQMEESDILDTLALVHKYGLTELKLPFSEYLKQRVSLTNVCAILNATLAYDLEQLKNVCLTFLDRNPESILQHVTFLSLSQESLQEILKRDTFYAPEIEIFVAVSDWCKHNSKSKHDVASVVSKVRLSIMDMEQSLEFLRQSEFLDPDKLLDAIKEQATSKSLPYRGLFWPEQNVVTLAAGASQISGELRDALFDGNSETYARQLFSDTSNTGITIKLGRNFFINHIKLLLWDKDPRTYWYYVEVSVNQKDWERVVDKTKVASKSWQHLYFPHRVVRFIKLFGTHNTANREFHVISVDAMFTASTPR